MALPPASTLAAPTTRERPPQLSAFTAAPHALSPEQHQAYTAMHAKLDAGFSATLMDGVTGSGKTEVYFTLIETLLKTPDAQILVLLPEIALSVQWLQRFTQHFGAEPVVWHSGVSPAQRKHAWRAIANGTARVVVGARSALFLPYRNLKLITIDEEHDSSYKQEEGVIYQARDMAVARARFEKIPLLLVSATPSLETYHNVQTHRYGALHLHARHAGAQFPQVGIIDMRTAHLDRGAFIAEPLRQALADTLARGNQSLLFLNRRGYAPLVLCRTCGHRFQCPNCTAWMVLHQGQQQAQHGGNQRGQQTAPALSTASCEAQQAHRGGNQYLQCHHCGHRYGLPNACPECKAEESLFPCGPGVERIAEEVKSFLPQARVEILASDSAESHEELQERIRAMERGDIDILIGTQMIAKGHHFGNLSLVGVVDADLGLGGGDLRAGERTYQLLHQLSGRAGRETVPGTVLLQSFMPDHPVMRALMAGERDPFMELELAARRNAHMPPFTRLAALIVEGADEGETQTLARELARTAPHFAHLDVLGPAPAPLYRLRGKFRFRLLLRADRQINIQEVLAAWLKPFKLPAHMRIKVDIDPYHFL